MRKAIKDAKLLMAMSAMDTLAGAEAFLKHADAALACAEGEADDSALEGWLQVIRKLIQNAAADAAAANNELKELQDVWTEKKTELKKDVKKA